MKLKMGKIDQQWQKAKQLFLQGWATLDKGAKELSGVMEMSCISIGMLITRVWLLSTPNRTQKSVYFTVYMYLLQFKKMYVD